IRRPIDFWNWVIERCSEMRQLARVGSANKAFRGGGWPWDRAFMQASAYLAVTQELPNVSIVERQSTVFPFWVALDKHTPEGKEALRRAAKIVGIPWRQALWVSFYFESALTNAAVKSSWWEREIQWRLRRIGLSYDEARSVWYEVQSVVSEVLKPAA